MNKLLLLAGFVASTSLLTACGDLPEYANGAPDNLTTDVTRNFNLNTTPAVTTTATTTSNALTSAISGALAGATPPTGVTIASNVAATAPIAAPTAPAIAAVNTAITAPAMQIPNMNLNLGAQAQQAFAPQIAAAPNTTAFAPTPMALHSNVVGSFGGNLGFDGYNGVRPFIVNTGSVWNGPATYMLPLRAANYTHQHLETVTPIHHSSVVSSVVSEPTVIESTRIIESEPVKVVASVRRARALKNTFMRKGPSFNAEKCNVLKKGHSATVHRCEGMWCEVTHDGVTGWSSRRNLSFVN